MTDLRPEGVPGSVSRMLTELLVIELSRLPDVDVIAYTDADAWLEHTKAVEGLQASLECADEECWGRVGRALDADYLLHGSVGVIDQRMALALTLVYVDDPRVVGRTSQLLRGDDEAVLSALQAAALNIVLPVLQPEAAAAGQVTLRMLAQLETARRKKPWGIGLRAGAGMPFVAAEEPLFRWPFLTVRGEAHYALRPWLLIGAELGVDYLRSTNEGDILFGDFSSASLVSATTRSDAELLTGVGALSLWLRASDGLLLPFARVSVGGAAMALNLGDVIPDRTDLPASFASAREGSMGVAAYGALGTGAHILMLDQLGVILSFDLFAYLNNLEHSAWPVGAERRESMAIYSGRPLGIVSGAQLTLGGTWQGR